MQTLGLVPLGGSVIMMNSSGVQSRSKNAMFSPFESMETYGRATSEWKVANYV